MAAPFALDGEGVAVVFKNKVGVAVALGVDARQALVAAPFLEGQSVIACHAQQLKHVVFELAAFQQFVVHSERFDAPVNGAVWAADGLVDGVDAHIFIKHTQKPLVLGHRPAVGFLDGFCRF